MGLWTVEEDAGSGGCVLNSLASHRGTRVVLKYIVTTVDVNLAVAKPKSPNGASRLRASSAGCCGSGQSMSRL